MNHFLLFLVLFHALADSLWQSGALCMASHGSVWRLLLHSVIYTAALFVPMFSLGFLSIDLSAIVAAALGVLHLVTNCIKRAVTARHNSPKAALVSFAAGQSLHLLLLWVASLCVQPYIAPSPWFTAIPDLTSYIKGTQMLTAMLIVYKPAAHFVKLLLDTLPKPASKSTKDDKMTDAAEDTGAGGGRLIGILERELIILLAFSQQFGAIGFVLAAKSIARYKQLEEQSFAEKYLVGTLSSALIALLVSLLMMNAQWT
jgi:hypothetical protein